MMMVTNIQCACRGVEVQISGKAMLQYVCHCNDCQAAYGKAFPCSFPGTLCAGSTTTPQIATNSLRAKVSACDKGLGDTLAGRTEHPAQAHKS